RSVGVSLFIYHWPYALWWSNSNGVTDFLQLPIDANLVGLFVPTATIYIYIYYFLLFFCFIFYLIFASLFTSRPIIMRHVSSFFGHSFNFFFSLFLSSKIHKN